MNKIFIDCGFHLGEGLTDFTNLLNIDENWKVYIFEANPACDIFNKITSNLNINVYDKAVWVHSDGVIFNQENNNVSNSPKINSTSILDGWGSCIGELNSSHTISNQVFVETIDMSNWITQFSGCEIYCKMDIEGAEFKILRKMIKDGTISMFTELWVEWHDADLPDENIDTRNELISEISQYCKLNSWK
jgi:FkbM family methyltransferase